MNISKYAAFFHDGSLMEVKHIGNNIEFSMASAEMDEEDNEDNIALSKKYDNIAGKLHIERVKDIIINEKPFLGKLKKMFDDGAILHFECSEKSTELWIKWVNYPPNPEVNEFTVIHIEAEKIWWENIPNLEELLEG